MKDNSHLSVFGIYRNQNEILSSLSKLKDLGISENEIRILKTEKDGSQDFPNIQKCQIKKGMFIGSAIGSAIGAIASLISFFYALLGLNSFQNTFGGFLALIIPVGFATLAGGVVGVLIGIGTPDSLGKRYRQYLNAGGILLGVHCYNKDQIEKAILTLENSGGQDVHKADGNLVWKEVGREADSPSMAFIF